MKKLAALLLLVLVTSSCSWSLGSKETHTNPTLGQELIDLKRARDDGAISEDEYEKTKRSLQESASRR